MKKFLTFSLVIMALYAANTSLGQAKVWIPSFEGRVHNHTGMEDVSDTMELYINTRCRKRVCSILGCMLETKESENVRILFDRSGKFLVPAMEMDSKKCAERTVDIHLKQGEDTEDKWEMLYLFSLYGKKIKKLPELLNHISLYATSNAQDFDVEVKNYPHDIPYYIAYYAYMTFVDDVYNKNYFKKMEDRVVLGQSYRYIGAYKVGRTVPQVMAALGDLGESPRVHYRTQVGVSPVKRNSYRNFYRDKSSVMALQDGFPMDLLTYTVDPVAIAEEEAEERRRRQEEEDAIFCAIDPTDCE